MTPLSRSGDSAPPPRTRGDEIVSDANMVFDHANLIDASPDEVWPWLLQLGKQRAGWYLPARWERMLPARRRAIRTIDRRWQALTVGDRIPDYGGREEWLEVAEIDPPHALVFRSERRGRTFTWALLLTATDHGGSELRLRFRGRLRSRGVRRRLILAGAAFFDWSTGKLMILGLRERLDGSANT